jgi:CMP-N-acetylneuraminic acid synthetase
MRSGSKGVKNKNLKLINKKPLMSYTISQAVNSKLFDNIIVSTNSKKILKKAKFYGADGWFLRPKKLSSDYSPKVPAIKHALFEAEKHYNKKFDIVIDLDAIF